MKNRYLPFGYKIADGKIVADSEQVEAVRRIFDAYTAGQTFQQIADALSAQGIPYRSDASRWNKNMVSRILANADYCGTAEYPQIITAGQFEAAEQAAVIRKGFHDRFAVAYHTGLNAFCQPGAAQSGTAHFFHILSAELAANILRTVFESIDIHGFLLPGIKISGKQTGLVRSSALVTLALFLPCVQ